MFGNHPRPFTIIQTHNAYSCLDVFAYSDTRSEIAFLNFPTQQTPTHPLKLYSCRGSCFFCAPNQMLHFSLVIAFILLNHNYLFRELSSSPNSGLCRKKDNVLFIFVFLAHSTVPGTQWILNEKNEWMMNRKGKKIHPIRAVKKDLMDDIGFELHFQKWDKSWIRGRNETESIHVG